MGLYRGTYRAPKVAEPPVSTLDGCDHCGQTAAVFLAKGLLTLAFCGHHYRDHEILLMAGGWQIVLDNRDALAARP